MPSAHAWNRITHCIMRPHEACRDSRARCQRAARRRGHGCAGCGAHASALQRAHDLHRCAASGRSGTHAAEGRERACVMGMATGEEGVLTAACSPAPSAALGAMSAASESLFVRRLQRGSGWCDHEPGVSGGSQRALRPGPSAERRKASVLLGFFARWRIALTRPRSVAVGLRT